MQIIQKQEIWGERVLFGMFKLSHFVQFYFDFVTLNHAEFTRSPLYFPDCNSLAVDGAKTYPKNTSWGDAAFISVHKFSRLDRLALSPL